ncbi:MAG: hypothetical protein ACRD50_09830 [Candidatus Acidiferrales bacterium]
MSSSAVHLAPSNRFCISLGEVPLSLYIAEESLFQSATTRYSLFQTPCESSQNELPVYIDGEGVAAPSSSHFAYTLHDSATVSLSSSEARFLGIRNGYDLDSLLRILLSMVLLPSHGFLLHAATIVRKGQAYIFAGRSGAGKSTVAALSPPGSVLTDEISILRFIEGAWHAYGTPFWGEFRDAGANARVPVAGVYDLIKAPEESAQPLSVKKALLALLRNVMFFAPVKQQVDKLMRMLLQAAEQLPFYELRFRPDASFWGVVRQ